MSLVSTLPLSVTAFSLAVFTLLSAIASGTSSTMFTLSVLVVLSPSRSVSDTVRFSNSELVPAPAACVSLSFNV